MRIESLVRNIEFCAKYIFLEIYFEFFFETEGLYYYISSKSRIDYSRRISC